MGRRGYLRRAGWSVYRVGVMSLDRLAERVFGWGALAVRVRAGRGGAGEEAL